MRKLFMSFAVAGFLFAGCSSNEVEEFNSLSPDAIKITASTTRAEVSDYESLKPGIKVWTRKANNTSGWYIGGINYLYSANAWKWASGTWTWPADGAADYPMQFYAINPAANETGKTTFAPTTGTSAYPNITGTVTIGGPAGLTDITTISAEKQTDVLHATTLNVTQKPASGYLPLDFKHILSKINVGVIAGTNTTVHVQSVAIRNVKQTGTYNYVTSVWSAPTSLAGYNYLVVGDGRAPFPYAGGDAEAVFTTATDRNLMLMPQTSASWDVSTLAKAASTLNSGAYIEVVYRLEKTGGSEIGYADATDYLDDNPTYTDPSIATWKHGTIANYGARGFFIKVGFPLATGNFTWKPGYGYTYNIQFGTSDAINGNYTDDTYYDDEGGDTGIPITKGDGSGDPVDPGEPVTTNYIYFDLSVTNFNDDEVILK